MDGSERKETAQRALVYVAVAVAVVIVLVFLWYALDVVLLAFLGILVAILVRAPADWLAEKTGMGKGFSLAMVGIGLLGLIATGLFFFGKGVAQESLQLVERVPEIVEAAKERLRETELGRRAVDLAESSGMFSGGESQFLGRGLGLLGSTFGAVANVLIVLFFAVFLAMQPQIYIAGFLFMVPRRKRNRVEQVLYEIGHVLRRWLVAQSVLAVVVGTLTAIGLLLIGAPFALPLAVLAGLMEFVPYIGPFIAAIPAVVVGLGDSPDLALKVALLFVAVQMVESYVLAPLAQHRAVYLPPAVVLFAQVVMGVVVGGLGVAVATPLAAALLVAINMLYVQDVLDDKTAGLKTET
ncbi:MAG TPA: AI-2E family transporter [Burkholderiales bacterium]|nr:AI-2E family transporter [Burkholderiales bacterium]